MVLSLVCGVTSLTVYQCTLALHTAQTAMLSTYRYVLSLSVQAGPEGVLVISEGSV